MPTSERRDDDTGRSDPNIMNDRDEHTIFQRPVKDAPRAERALSGREHARARLPALPVRRDHPLGAHAPALLSLQGARVRDGLPARKVRGRRGGALAAALRPARVARRQRAAPGLALRRVVHTPLGPLAPDRLVAPVDARRDLTFLLAEPERRLLRAIAQRLPAWVTSDQLTLVGVVGALGAGVAYALSALSPAWLWVAGVLLLVNWFGDSLDGTLARLRRAERRRYGYYLDHVVDAFATAAIGAGIGLSPYVPLSVALAGVVAYLVLSINLYLESTVFGVFRLGYGRIGPTEARIVLVLANGLLVTAGADPAVVTIATCTAAALALAMLVTVALRIGRNLAELAKLEPLPRRVPTRGSRAPFGTPGTTSLG